MDYIVIDYYYCQKCEKYHYSHKLLPKSQYKHLGFKNHFKYAKNT